MKSLRNNDANLNIFYAIVFLPILSLYYLFPPINLGYFLLVIVIILSLLMKKNIQFNKSVISIGLLLVLINSLTTIRLGYDIQRSINNSLSILFFYFVVSIVLNQNVSSSVITKVSKTLYFVSVITTFFLIVQLLMYKHFNYVFLGKIPFLTPIEDRFQSIYYGRPTSVFFEPAHYIIYVAPIYYISLVQKKYIITTLIFTGMILSTSSTGIFLALFIPLIIKIIKNESFMWKFAFVIALGIFLLFANITTIEIIQKFSYNNILNSIRLFGNIDIVNHYKLGELMFGIGLNNLSLYADQSGLYYPNYSNAIIFSIISFGFIGGLLCLGLFIYIFFNKRNPIYFGLGIITLLLLATDQLLFNHNLMYLVLITIMFNSNRKIPTDEEKAI